MLKACFFLFLLAGLSVSAQTNVGIKTVMISANANINEEKIEKLSLLLLDEILDEKRTVLIRN
ncbi:MAG: hypothetical protein JKY48_03235 [Flavobacteriales bacterium]|nr:hypothetical protein [Flavobacteriales bacterium]